MAARPLPTPDVDTTPRRILRVVEELLAEGGEASVSIREICVRAAVTPPTIYHHFGDKQSLVDRVVSDCFIEFDRILYRRGVPSDPVAALRVGFDRYVEYGIKHPSHYRLMFGLASMRPTQAGLASFERCRAGIAAVHAAGRLRTSIDDATFAFWSAAHGITSLLIAGFGRRDAVAVALVRDALITQLTQDEG